MAVSYDKSTYKQLIDSVLFELNDVRTAQLKDNALMVWILEAQRKTSELFEIRCKYTLGLNEDVSEYPIQNRPAITGVTNATPMVATAAAHGVSNDDRVHIVDVQGNTAANGQFQVAGVAANTFNLYQFADIDNAEADSTTVTVETVKEHNFSTGNSVTISGVVGMTDLNASHTITVVDSKSFTVPLVTTQSYTSGGVALKAAAGNGTYVSGGKFWRDDEIPPHFRPNSFEPIQRAWSTHKPLIEIVEWRQLVDQVQYDAERSNAYSDLDSPFMCSEWTVDGVRKLFFHPAPGSDHEVELYGRMQINPKLYYSDLVTDYIVLPSTFDEIIEAYLKYKVHLFLKNYQLAGAELDMFHTSLKSVKDQNRRHFQQKITWY